MTMLSKGPAPDGMLQAGPHTVGRVETYNWEEIFYTPSPLGINFKDCECVRIDTTTSIHHLHWVVVVVYKMVIPNKR